MAGLRSQSNATLTIVTSRNSINNAATVSRNEVCSCHDDNEARAVNEDRRRPELGRTTRPILENDGNRLFTSTLDSCFCLLLISNRSAESFRVVVITTKYNRRANARGRRPYGFLGVFRVVLLPCDLVFRVRYVTTASILNLIVRRLMRAYLSMYTSTNCVSESIEII